MKFDVIAQLIKEDAANSLGGAFENDYKEVLSKWEQATSEQEQKEVLRQYFDILASEKVMANQWYAALVKRQVEGEE